MSKYTLTLDASQLNLYGKCNLAWAYVNRERLQLTGADSDALSTGTLVHLILEAYYKAKLKYIGLDFKAHAQAAIDAFDNHNLVRETKLDRNVVKLVKDRFGEYVFHYQNNDLMPAINNEIPGVEIGFSKVLYENDELIFIVEGKIDLLLSNVFVDHKSQSRTNYLYNFRPQMLTYAWATGFNGAMINYFGLQKNPTKDTFRRDTINIPNWMIARWERKMLKIFYEISNIERYCDDNEINENKFERNFSNCSGSFDSNPCQFAPLCETESDEMRENLKNFKYEKTELWTPWQIKENELLV